MAKAMLAYQVLVLVLVVNLISAYDPQPTLPACVNSKQGYTCGKAGYPGNNAPVVGKLYRNVTSLDACRIECLQRQRHVVLREPFCDSLAYNSDQKTCSTYNKTVAALPFTANSSSPFVFYDYPCFTCLRTCPPNPSSGNLLVNPDFEHPTASSQTTFGQFTYINPESPWNDGNQSNYRPVNIVNTGYNASTSLSCFQSNCKYGQYLDICSGSLYSITFNYFVKTASPQNVSYQVEAGDLSSGGLMFPASDNNAWHPFREDFFAIGDVAAPNIINTQINIITNSATHVYVDNIAVQPATISTPSASSPNLLGNGNFESGTLAPWTVSNGYGPKKFPIITTPGYKSNHSITCNAQKSTISQCGLTSQNLTLTRYQSYVFSLVYKKTGTACNDRVFGNGVQATFYQTSNPNADGEYPYTQYTIGLDEPPELGQWITVSRQFIAQGDISNLNLDFAYPQGCSVLVDDVSLKAV